MNKFIKYIFILLLPTLVNASDLALEKLIAIANQSNAKLAVYVYNDKKHYLLDHRHLCCDLGATLYNEQGIEVCQYIGFAGTWQQTCKEFDSKSKLIKYVGTAAKNT